MNSKTVDDDLLLFYFEIIEQKVLNFCHRQDIPPELELLLVEMVAKYIDLITVNRNGQLQPAGPVQSIKRGDTTIQYFDGGASSRTSDTNFQDFLNDWKTQLYAFRKLVSL